MSDLERIASGSPAAQAYSVVAGPLKSVRTREGDSEKDKRGRDLAWAFGFSPGRKQLFPTL